jgi:hypothetical protein
MVGNLVRIFFCPFIGLCTKTTSIYYFRVQNCAKYEIVFLYVDLTFFTLFTDTTKFFFRMFLDILRYNCHFILPGNMNERIMKEENAVFFFFFFFLFFSNLLTLLNLLSQFRKSAMLLFVYLLV